MASSFYCNWKRLEIQCGCSYDTTHDTIRDKAAIPILCPWKSSHGVLFRNKDPNNLMKRVSKDLLCLHAHEWSTRFKFEEWSEHESHFEDEDMDFTTSSSSSSANGSEDAAPEENADDNRQDANAQVLAIFWMFRRIFCSMLLVRNHAQRV